MSRKKYLINNLEACEKHEFDKIVKSYLREIYNFNRMSVTDGKDDVGLDIKVFDFNSNHIQYQLTTQKSTTAAEKSQLDLKIKEDFEKAKKNFQEYGYTNSLFYFYSKKLTNKVIRNYEKEALNYGINLTMIDANRIADEAEEYLELQRTIIETNDISDILSTDSLFPDSEKNILFDLVSFGETSLFKLQIIEAYLLEELFQKNMLTLTEIIDSCTFKFKTKENDVFYEKLLSRLMTSKTITKNSEKTHFLLTDGQREIIIKLKEQHSLDEKNFIYRIELILEKYKQDELIEEYIFQLKALYTENFNSDISQVVENSSASDFSGLSRNFNNFLKNNISSNDERLAIVNDLFEYCKEDIFLQKYCASKVFGERTNLAQIEKYINSKKRIFIDTQVSLYGLCYYFKPKVAQKNYFFQTTKSLLELARKNNFELFLPERYLWETSSHFQEAFNLVPFSRLSNVHKLGGSRNVFYNYYNFLIENSVGFDLSYSEFLESFGFTAYTNYKTQNRIIASHLEKIGIKVIEIPKEYPIHDISDMMQWEIDTDVRVKFKSKFNLHNDSIIFAYLSDDDSDVHPLQPIFLTWDKIFFKMQPKYFRDFPNSQRWFLMSPGKFIDQYSLLHFKIDSEIFTNEILALLSDNIVRTTHSLLDNITLILNPDDEIGLEYTNRLAEMRDKELYKISEQELILPEEFENEAVIDSVFYKLTSYYIKKEDNSIDKFKSVFLKKQLIDEVMVILELAVKDYYEKKKFDESIYKKFDDLISAQPRR